MSVAIVKRSSHYFQNERTDMVIYFVGPKLFGITGQSISFDKTCSLKKRLDRVFCISSHGDSKFRSILRFVIQYTRFVSLSIIERPGVIYITTSRSKLGFLRDMAVIISGRCIFGAKIVNHLHGSDFKDFRGGCSKSMMALVDFVYSKVEFSILLHKSMADQYDMYRGMETFFVPNFVAREFSIDKKKRTPPPDIIRILFFSNIIKEKGILDLVEAVDEMVASGDKVVLTIAGSEGRISLKNMLQERFGVNYRLGSHVSFLGGVYGADRLSLYADADIFVLPSYFKSEAFPISVIEAMFCGCSVITSDFKYLPEIFKDHGVVFCKHQCPRDLRDALRREVNSILCRDLKNVDGREIVDSRYTEEMYVKRIEYIFEKVKLLRINKKER